MSKHVKFVKLDVHHIFAVSVAVRRQRPEVAGVAGFTVELGAVGTRCWNMFIKVRCARGSYEIAPPQPLSPKDKTAEYDGHLIPEKHTSVFLLLLRIFHKLETCLYLHVHVSSKRTSHPSSRSRRARVD
mgnify:CR=1 FL=1